MGNPSTYTKSRLVKELAFSAGISQVKSRKVLETLHAIVMREAAAGPFILPGLCKFDTVVRKERRMRNPRTGEALVLPEHKVLRITPAKSIREAVAPRVSAIKLPPEAVEPAATPVGPAEAPVVPPQAEPAVQPPPVMPPAAPAQEEAPAAPAADKIAEAGVIGPSETPPAEPENKADDGFILPGLAAEEPATEPMPKQVPPAEIPFTVAPNGDVTFHCPNCGQEIEAPGDMAGTDAECPMCGTMLHIPLPAGAAAPAARPAKQEVVSAAAAEAIDPSALKNKTIRIDATELGFDEPAAASKPGAGGDSGMISFFCPGCHQEIEATADMAGTVSECPNCGTEFEVPFFSEKGTIHADKDELFDPRKANEQKHKTMRIDLDDF